MVKKVIIFRPGIANIGDEFITIGAEYVVKEVWGSVEILKIYSPYGSSIFQSSLSFGMLKNIVHAIISPSLKERLSYKVTRGNTLKVFEYVKYLPLEDYDFIVIILFIGVGGESYTPNGINAVKTFLRKLKPKLLVSRDPIAFQLYKDLAKQSFNGLDLAFYVSDLFKPSKLKLDYIILNFDYHRVPKINLPANTTIVRMHNSTKIIKRYWYKEKNFFISDNPYDYLTLIANAKEVHTDKIHTAVAAASYGVKWRFHGKTIRKHILEKIKGKNLEREKKEMLKFIKQAINNV